jgi:hypothetical protein
MWLSRYQRVERDACGILKHMKHRFLLHALNHTILVVDITSIGLPTGIIGDEGEARSLPSIRFRTWHEAERHFLALGAKQKYLETADESLRKTSTAVLTITRD